METGSEQNKNSISRRTLLKRTAGVIGTSALGTAGIKTGQRLLENLNQPPSKEETRKRFNVLLISLPEARSIMNNDRTKSLPGDVDWDSKRIEMVNNYLPELPKPFLNPIGGKQVHMSLFGEESGCDGLCGGATIDTINAPIILLSRKNFDKYEKRTPFESLTHEFIHLTNWDEAWQPVPRINEIFGGDFGDKREEIRQMLSRSMYINLIEGESEFDSHLINHIAVSMHRSALLDSHPTEFIAYLGQAYVYGREKFLSVMSKLFDSQKALQLYDYAKGELFFGKEYKRFPVSVYTKTNVTDTKRTWIETRKMKNDEW